MPVNAGCLYKNGCKMVIVVAVVVVAAAAMAY